MADEDAILSQAVAQLAIHPCQLGPRAIAPQRAHDAPGERALLQNYSQWFAPGGLELTAEHAERVERPLPKLTRGHARRFSGP